MSTMRTATAAEAVGYSTLSLYAADRHDGIDDHHQLQDEGISLSSQTIYYSNASHPYYFQGDSLMTYVDDNHNHHCYPHPSGGPHGGEYQPSPYDDDLEMSDSDEGVDLYKLGDLEPIYYLHTTAHLEMDLEHAPPRPTGQAGDHDDLPLPVPTSHSTADQPSEHHDSIAAFEILEAGATPEPFGFSDEDELELSSTTPTIGTQTEPELHPTTADAAPQAPAQEDEPELDHTQPPFGLTNLHPGSLGPDNLDLDQFLQHWSWNGRFLTALTSGVKKTPDSRKVTEQMAGRPSRVRYEELSGDHYDPQGIDWHHLGASRQGARERRLRTYKNYTNKLGSDTWHVSSS
jgi:hypothetical protein